MSTYTKFNNFLYVQMGGTSGAATRVNFLTDTIKVALYTSATAPDPTWATISQVTCTEVTGTGYTAGGETVTTPALTQSGSNIKYTGDNITWTYSSTGFSNARYGIIYKDTGTGTTSTLIGYYDLLTNQGNTVVPFSAIFDPTLGIIGWN